MLRIRHGFARPAHWALISAGMMLAGTTAAQARTTAGIGVAAVPAYQGADNYRVLPFPVLDVQVGQIFANVNNGIGIYVIDTPGLKMGGSVTFVQGYRDRDTPRGIDNLSDALGGRMFASVTLAGLRAQIGATRSIGGGTRGTVVDAQLAYPLRAGPKLLLIPTLSTSWANDKHMDRYFSVTPVESAASGLATYRASGGFKDVSAGVTANYRLAGRLNLTGSVTMIHLLDKAGNSPFVEKRWQPFSFVGLSYSF